MKIMERIRSERKRRDFRLLHGPCKIPECRMWHGHNATHFQED